MNAEARCRQPGGRQRSEGKHSHAIQPTLPGLVSQIGGRVGVEIRGSSLRWGSRVESRSSAASSIDSINRRPNRRTNRSVVRSWSSSGIAVSLGAVGLCSGYCRPMRHRHLTTRRYTPAAIDDVLENGTLADWRPMFVRVRREPWGETAEAILRILRSRPANYVDPETGVLWSAYIAHHRARRPLRAQD
jgi:hypothetical protein